MNIPTLTPSQAILIGLIVAPAIFALCAFFTRANLSRIAGALGGAIAYCLVQYAWDRAAAAAGWWSYPAYGTGASLPMPVAIYILSGLTFAGFGLIGWRLARRYEWKGLLTFLAAWSLWGFTLDHAGSALFASSRLMVIGASAAAHLADFLVYATCMASVLLAIRLAGGPFWNGAKAGIQESSANSV